MPRESYYVPAGNTLDSSALPSTRGSLLEQPVALAPGAGSGTLLHLAGACALGSAVLEASVPFDDLGQARTSAIIMGAFALCALFAAARGTLPAKSLIALFVVALAIGVGLLPWPVQLLVALCALTLLGVLLTLHWVLLSSAAPCRPEVTLRVRRNLGWRLLVSVLAFPVLLPYALFCLVWHFRSAAGALVSFLYYQQDGVRAAGIFRSPGGPRTLRLLLFHGTLTCVTKAAVMLPRAVFPVPIPQTAPPTPYPQFDLCGMFGLSIAVSWFPMALSMGYCLLLLSPYLPTLPSSKE
jgi:hypothetical protein